jgi:N-acetylglucosamine kinase-like BadF-type ATPase
MSQSIGLAVDGGNSKTDLVLIRADGEVLSLVRGPESSPHKLGLEGALDVLDNLLTDALRLSGLAGRNGAVAEVARLLMAGVDVPAEEEELRQAVGRRGWATRTAVGNDTFAVLRAGTERGWGVAVVCGAGINCVGVSPDGRHARFPALGTISGDWGGGYDVGLAGLHAAARGEDGRGPKTSLEHSLPKHFGVSSPQELAEEIHAGRIDGRRLQELPPLIFADAAQDDVAASIVDRLASEVVALARVALERLELEDQATEILLGGGLLQAADERLIGAIERGLHEFAPAAIVHQATSRPIVGAALLALDDLGADGAAQSRLRDELGAAAERVERRRSDG